MKQPDTARELTVTPVQLDMLVPAYFCAMH